MAGPFSSGRVCFVKSILLLVVCVLMSGSVFAQSDFSEEAASQLATSVDTQKARHWRKKGFQCMEAKNYPEAVRAFEKLVECDNSAVSLYSLAEAKSKAINLESKKMGVDYKSIVGSVDHPGVRKVRAGYEEIISLCTECLAKDEDCFPALMLRGTCKIGLGRNTEAMADLDLARTYFQQEKPPVDKWSHQKYDAKMLSGLYFAATILFRDFQAESLLQPGMEEVGRDVLKRGLNASLSLEPKFWLSRVALAQVYYGEGSLLQSLWHAEIAVKDSSGYSTALLMRGMVYLNLCRVPESLNDFQTAKRHPAAGGGISFWQGQTHLMMGDLPESVMCFSKVIEKPICLTEKVSALSYRAEVYRQLKKNKLAEKDEKTIQECFDHLDPEAEEKVGYLKDMLRGSQPENSDASVRSKLFYFLGFYDACLLSCNQIMKKASSDSKEYQEACLRKGCILIARGEIQKGLDLFDVLSQPYSSLFNAKVCFAKSSAFTRLNDMEHARRWQEKGMDALWDAEDGKKTKKIVL